MARGRKPNHQRRARADTLREDLHRVRLAHKRVLIAEGHLANARTAQHDAVRRAFDNGATHKELAAALGRTWRPGWTAYALHRRRAS